MRHLLLQAGAAASMLAILSAYGPAQAVSRLSLEAAPLVVPVMDEENLAVEENLRPDEVPEGAGKEEALKGAAQPPASEGSGNVENQELWRDLETGVTPPPGE